MMNLWVSFIFFNISVFYMIANEHMLFYNVGKEQISLKDMNKPISSLNSNWTLT